MKWFLWAFVLMMQNASFTWTSRARNSGDWRYSALASLCSNGTWVVVQLFLVTTVIAAARSGNLWDMVLVVLFYTVFTTIGATLAHRFLLGSEKGKRRVGANVTHRKAADAGD